MRKIIVLIVTLFVMNNLSASNRVSFPKLNSEVVISEDVECLVNEIVPSDVREAFLYATSSEDKNYQDTIRMYLLAVGEKESEWKFTQSHKPNKDGSMDIGYLMLNEDNLDDPIFQKHFMPKKDEFEMTNFQEFLIITCVNFYKYLFNRYGDDACYAYNAGERRYIENRLPEATYRYKLDILDNLNNYLEDLTYIVIDRKMYEQEMIRKERDRRINELITKPIAYISSFKPELEVVLNLCNDIIYITTDFEIILYAKDPNEEINKKLGRKCIIFIFDDDIILRKTVFTMNGKQEIEELIKNKKYNVYI